LMNGKGREILNSHNEWSEIAGRRDKNVKFLPKGKGTMQKVTRYDNYIGI